MERLTDPFVDQIAVDESEEWIRHLAAHGVVKLIGELGDPCKVIRLSEEIWGRLHSARSKSLDLAGPSRSASSALAERDEPRSPAEFVESLKRRRQESRSSLVKVGPHSVPAAIRHIAEHIESIQTRVVEEASEDEEQHGVDQATWDRAIGFIVRSAAEFWIARRIAPPVPTIGSDYEGGIDVVWRYRHRALYMNVPEQPTNVVTFYGRDQDNPDLRIRGEENVEGTGEWILNWLVR